MDGGPARVAAICKGKGTRKRMGRCTQDAGSARGEKTVRGQEFEYGDHEMQKGASAIWSAADAAGSGTRADERVGRGLSFWDDVRPVGTGGDEIAAGISGLRGHARGRRWTMAEAQRG